MSLSRKQRRLAEKAVRKESGRRAGSADALAAAGELFRAGEYAQAAKVVRAVLAKDPSVVAAWVIIGGCAWKTGDLDGAEMAFGEATRLDPSAVGAYNGLAHVRSARGDADGARAMLDLALGVDPRNFPALYASGLLASEAGRLGEAAGFLRRALDVQDDPSVRLRLGDVLNRLGRHAEARAELGALLASRSAAALPAHERGRVLVVLGRHAEAEALLRGALAGDPGHVMASVFLAEALRGLGRAAEAEAVLRAARPFEGGDVAKLAALAADAATEQGALARAEVLLEAAVRIAPDEPGPHLDLARLLLLRGERGGWAEYAWRDHGQRRRRKDLLPAREWLGGPIAGGKLIVVPEQGVGDQMLFGCLLAEAEARAGRVVVVADRLAPAFERSGVEVVRPSDGVEVGGADRAVMAGDLPRVLGRPPQPGTAAGGYLRADPRRTADLRRAYAAGGRPVVGVSWRSDNVATGRPRSVDLAALLASLPQGCDVVSLQYGDVDAEVEAASAATGRRVLRDRGIDQVADLDGLLAQVAAVDAVVTVDNTTAHAAGAVGAEAAVLLPKAWGLTWYWGVEGDRDPWYGGLVLCRQSVQGDWTDPLARSGAFVRGRLGL